MRFSVCALLLGVLLAAGPLVCAQKVAEEPEYVLGPADVIDVTVNNHSELDKTLTVLPDGKIAFPSVGEMKAAGKTPRALAAEIQAELEKTRNNVAVSVTVKEQRPRRVRVIGAVKTPGSYDVRKGMDRLLDVVAAAGGLSAKPTRTLGRVIRGGDQVIQLDVPQAIANPESSANVPLQVDDLLLFDEVEGHNQVQVIGQVAKPGVFDLDVDTNAVSLLAQAGSPTEKAALAKSYVLRSAVQIPLNLRQLLVDGKAPDSVVHFKFQSGDVLFIPENDVKFAVMGQVAKPGYFPFPERGTVTVLDAINLASGQVPGGDSSANLSHVSIIRMVNGKATMIHVNVDRILKKADLAGNAQIQPEDIVYVPGRRSRLTASDVLSPFSLLAVMGLRLFR